MSMRNIAKTIGCLVWITLCSLIVSCSTPRPLDLLNRSLPAGAYTKKQLSYGQHSRQGVDIYLPSSGASKTPVIFVYGGTWRQGNKRDYEFVAHALTGLGHPVIIPDYRLFPEVQFPAFINDVATAISFIEQNSVTALNKPFTDYILMGHSAGAHTAALLATDQRYLKARKVSAKLSGLIAVAGPYDLPLNDPDVMPAFRGATPQQSNPTLNVRTGMPKVLLLHGLNDTRVEPFHTRRFDVALRRTGTLVTTRLYPGVNHTRIIGSLAAPLRFLNNSFADIKQFLAQF